VKKDSHIFTEGNEANEAGKGFAAIEKFPRLPATAEKDDAHADCEQCHPERRLAGPLVIEARDVHVRIQNNPVLRGVNLKIPKGEAVALIGPNGSGKTTLLRAILGLQKIDRGEVFFFGEKALF
jgi:ABC-type bacteriocin/lantibiotic exporter with double-glycine peptidase domain